MQTSGNFNDACVVRMVIQIKSRRVKFLFFEFWRLNGGDYSDGRFSADVCGIIINFSYIDIDSDFWKCQLKLFNTRMYHMDKFEIVAGSQVRSKEMVRKQKNRVRIEKSVFANLASQLLRLISV